jgi:putative phosphoesterase
MKLAIISDIHGNHDAWIKALEIIEKDRIDFIIFAGDICGYYFESLRIIDSLLKKKNLNAVIGNHDQIFLDNINKPDPSSIQSYTIKYGDSLKSFLKEVQPRHIKFLNSLPQKSDFMIDKIKFTLFHGGPLDYLNQKIFPDNDFSSFNHSNEFRVYILGHTHYRLFKKTNSFIIINPGSLGQPRDGNKGAFYLFDTENMNGNFIDIDYNYQRLYLEVLNLKNQPEYNSKVLLRPYEGKRNNE